MGIQEWHLNQEALSQMKPNYPQEKDLIQHLLNEDISSYADPFLKKLQHDGKQLHDQDLVLQIVKITNVGLPKLKATMSADSPSSRLLKIILSDGHSTISGVETETMPKLDANTAPGTKILIRFSRVHAVHKTLLLNSNNAQILGGNVEALVEKWKVAQSLLYLERSLISTENPPPPWVPFGQRISQAIETFKTLKNSESEKAIDDEYEVKREEQLKNIQGETKSFSKNVKQVRDNLFDVVAAGYTETAANYALNKTGGSTAAAIKLLQEQQQRRDNRRRRDDDEDVGHYRPSALNLGEFLGVNEDKKEPSTESNNFDRPIPDYRPYQRGNPRGRGSRNQRRGRGQPQTSQFKTSASVEQLTEDFSSWPGLPNEVEQWPGMEEAIAASKAAAQSTFAAPSDVAGKDAPKAHPPPTSSYDKQENQNYQRRDRDQIHRYNKGTAESSFPARPAVASQEISNSCTQPKSLHDGRENHNYQKRDRNEKYNNHRTSYKSPAPSSKPTRMNENQSRPPTNRPYEMSEKQNYPGHRSKAQPDPPCSRADSSVRQLAGPSSVKSEHQRYFENVDDGFYVPPFRSRSGEEHRGPRGGRGRGSNGRSRMHYRGAN